ncbi:MAG: hypothetical protein EBR82_58610 [Caulobacteraceae bacterium]|nr:hypothetical protein [Caulobacteraceae bacterium]
MAFEQPDSYGCGPFEVARRPDVQQFVDKLNRVRQAVDACRLQDGIGYTVNRSTNGTTLTMRPGRGGLQQEIIHPFRISVKKEDKKYLFYVLTGTIDGIIPKKVEEWVEFKPPANIYLEAELSEMKITEASIKNQPSDGELHRVEIAGGKQKYARISLGFYVGTQEKKDAYRVIQNVRTNLLAPLTVFEGYPAVIPLQEGYPAYPPETPAP